MSDVLEIVTTNSVLELPSQDGSVVEVSTPPAEVVELAGGMRGEGGKSAYQLAVDSGFFEGSLSAWLESLQGADGRDGEDGADGQDGADGTDATLPAVMQSASTYFPFHIPGTYFDNNLGTATLGNQQGVADRLDLFPFIVSRDVPINEIGFAVQTLLAASAGKVVVYDADPETYFPKSKLLETAALDCSSGGYKSASCTLTFEKGRVYWLGLRYSAGWWCRAITSNSNIGLGLQTAAGASYNNGLRTTLTFATPAPAELNLTSAQLTNIGNVPSIRMRAA